VPGMEEARYVLCYLVDSLTGTDSLGTHKIGLV